MIERFTTPRRGAMLRIVLAPCSPFSVSPDLMRDAAALARDNGVTLHTHLAENDEDVAYSLRAVRLPPGEYAEDLGWIGDDVWHAHCVKLDAGEIDALRPHAHRRRALPVLEHAARLGHRAGAGDARRRRARSALGVDGSASNDGRPPAGRGAAGAAAAARRARRRRDERARGAGDRDPRRRARCWAAARELGSIELGKRADLAIWDVAGLEAAGAWDPVAALVLCGPFRVRDLLVEGRRVVRDGRLTGVDLDDVLARSAACLRRLMA